MIDLLIIGSNSFSGAHLASEALKNGLTVAGISRSPEPNPVFLPYKALTASDQFRFFQHDLNTDFTGVTSVIQKLRPRWIANYAAQGMVAESWDNPDHWMMTNVVSITRLANFLRTCDFLDKFIHASTPEVYGSCTGTVNESAPFNPSTPYAVSKAACDMTLSVFHRQYGLPVVLTRAANVYGACQRLYRIIPKTVLSILQGRKLPLHGGGVSVRSFIHIKDVASATLSMLENAPAGSVYHLSTGRNVSIAQLVSVICDKMGVSFEETVEITNDRPGKDSAYLLDSSKARNEIGWSDRISLESGIDEVAGWIRDNIDILRTQPVEYIHLK